MPTPSDRINVTCQSCGKIYAVKAELVGRSAACSCGARIRILAAAAPVQPPVAASPPPASSSVVPNRKPADDHDYELESPVERDVPQSATRAIQTGQAATVVKHPKRRDGESKDSRARKFVGIYGFLIMGEAILHAVACVGAVIVYSIRPQAELLAALLVIGFVAVFIVIDVVIFRLGKGLVDGERSAVHGLLLLYLLSLAATVAAMVAMPESRSNFAIGAGILTLTYVPPLLVAYLNWGNFYVPED